MVVSAPAKLNLALAVGPPEPATGMHPIASWMHPITLSGSVRLQRSTSTSFDRRWAEDAPCRSPLDWPLERDLIVRAHRELEALCGRELPTTITLTKRVPVGGGLGGGSSEAAATLMGLNQLHILGLSTEQLAQAAGRLGSDVGFFLSKPHSELHPALATGLGDTIERVAPSRAGVVLIVPRFGCATADVYQAFDTHSSPPLDPDRVRSMAHGDPLKTELFNDLARSAMEVQPELGELIETVRQASGHEVRITGSGSTLFLLCAPGEQTQLAATLSGAVSPARVVACELCSPAR